MVASVSRPARVGIVAVLAGAVAVAAGYVNNCFTGLGFAPGAGTGQAEVSKPDVTRADASGKLRVVVQGEHCRIDGDATTQGCEDLCKQVKATAVDIEATAGTQGMVDRLKTCLQGRGLKVQVLSE